MTLLLHSEGSSANFVAYLRKFLNVSNFLLLEVDPKNKLFMAKSYTETRSIILCSSISFAECGFTVDDQSDIVDQRVLLGFYNTLKRQIDILSRYTSSFDIIINYEEVTGKETFKYFCDSIDFKSDKLSISLTGAGLSTSVYDYIHDEFFYSKIFTIKDSRIAFPFSKEVVNDIINVSKIYSIDTDKDILQFYSKGRDIMVRDVNILVTNSFTSNFEYKIYTLETEPPFQFELPIIRNLFVQLFDHNDEDFDAHISSSNGASEITRILFDSKNSITKMAISKTVMKINE